MTDSIFSPADAAGAAGTIQAIGDTPDGTSVALAGAGPVSADALAALAAAIDFAGQALAPATLRAYRADWQHFCAWCRAAGWAALPAAPATVAAYLASLAKTHTSSALVRRLAALSRAHRLARQPWPAADPAIRNTLRGIQRKFGRPVRQAAALATEEVRSLVATCENTTVGQRDRALLLLGYAGALRRSELVAIEYEHITFDKDGLRLLIPRAKGDQANKGVSIGIPRGSTPDTCPVRALEVWLKTSQCQHGPVFRGIDRAWRDRAPRAASGCRAADPAQARHPGRTGRCPGANGSARTACGRASSPRPISTARATSKSWTTRARRICERCAAMCAGPSSSPTVRPSCWASDRWPDARGREALPASARASWRSIVTDAARNRRSPRLPRAAVRRGWRISSPVAIAASGVRAAQSRTKLSSWGAYSPGPACPTRPAAATGEILCLPNPEWLPHLLTVTGPSEPLTAFRKAAAGPGTIAWQRDYARLEEDWVYTLLAPPPADRGISVHGARIVASQMRALIEVLEIRAADHARDENCPLDLNTLVPVPDKLLRLGPEDPAVLAWQWENWGTTWMLRDVALAPVGRAGVLVPPGHEGVSYRFWSADWTPWRALATVRTRWPALALHVKVLGINE